MNNEKKSERYNSVFSKYSVSCYFINKINLTNKIQN